MASDLHARIQALLARGAYDEAVRLCLEHGEPARAVALLLDVWRFEEALLLAEREGLGGLAYRAAVELGRGPARERALAALLREPAGEAHDAALRLCAARGLHADEGRLAQYLGDLHRAAKAFRRAEAFLEAASAHEAAGELPAAVEALTWALGPAPGPGDQPGPAAAEAALALARLHQRLGDDAAAVLALERVPATDARRPVADRARAVLLAGLGYPEAARVLAARVEPPGAAEGTRAEARHTDFDATLDAWREELGKAGVLHARVGAGDDAAEDGRRLGARYRIVRELGAGAAARVYLAEDELAGAPVAVKVFRLAEAGRDPYLRMMREARVMLGLRHPHIVRVHEAREQEGLVVMEYLGGGTLRERLADGPLPTDFARRVGVALLSALEAAHRAGVVHRDLKPSNVLLTEAGDVKLGDFGAAHLRDAGATKTGAMVGTLAYMAPEQITGAEAPSAQTDLYALGVLLFECFAGVRPFEGPDFVAQHLGEAPPALAERVPGAPQALAALVGALLEKDPAARPASASEALRALEAVPWGVFHLGAEPRARTSSPRAELPSPARAPSARFLAQGDRRLEDTWIGRVVVVPEAGDLDHVRRFAAADHPNLQAVYDWDPARGAPLLEAPSGETLASLFARGTASETDLERVAREVSAALAHLHARGAAHGQLDAEHIVVGPSRVVLLLPAPGAAAVVPQGDAITRDRAALGALVRGAAS